MRRVINPCEQIPGTKWDRKAPSLGIHSKRHRASIDGKAFWFGPSSDNRGAWWHAHWVIELLETGVAPDENELLDQIVNRPSYSELKKELESCRAWADQARSQAEEKSRELEQDLAIAQSQLDAAKSELDRLESLRGTLSKLESLRLTLQQAKSESFHLQERLDASRSSRNIQVCAATMLTAVICLIAFASGRFIAVDDANLEPAMDKSVAVENRVAKWTESPNDLRAAIEYAVVRDAVSGQLAKSRIRDEDFSDKVAEKLKEVRDGMHRRHANGKDAKSSVDRTDDPSSVVINDGRSPSGEDSGS